MLRRSGGRSSLVVLAVLTATATSAPAQDKIQHIKELYASAAYEDTLAAVSSLDASDPAPEIEQFRIFSLIALDRQAEAEKVVETVLTAHPRYRPDEADASPRIQALFTSVRVRVGPDAIRQLYQDGKAALEKKDRPEAIRLFDEMLATADDPDLKDLQAVADLRLLGAGFLELSRALPPPAPEPAATPPAPAPAPIVITKPVAIEETLPPWTPPPSAGTSLFAGSLRVDISATGTVDHVEIVEPIHPAYDSKLLEAARKWRYQPALRDGTPIPSSKTVVVRLKPPA